MPAHIVTGLQPGGLPSCHPRSSSQPPCGEVLRFSCPAPEDPSTQGGFLSTPSLPMLLPLSLVAPVTAPASERLAFLRGGKWPIHQWSRHRSPALNPVLLEHPQHNTFCSVFWLLITGFSGFFNERPKQVQLLAIPVLRVVDPRGDVIAGSYPTSSTGTAEEMKLILLLSNR